jgi:penicillin amidase
VTHQPARWLPQDVPDWNELLTIALDRGLEQAHAPSNLQKWSWSQTNIIDLEHPLFGLTPLVTKMVGMHTGTGRHALPGNMFTVRVGLPHHGASERFVVDPASPGDATLNIVLGQSGDPASPWYIDQWPTWLSGKTLTLPWSTNGTPSHTLTLTPQ